MLVFAYGMKLEHVVYTTHLLKKTHLPKKINLETVIKHTKGINNILNINLSKTSSTFLKTYISVHTVSRDTSGLIIFYICMQRT